MSEVTAPLDVSDQAPAGRRALLLVLLVVALAAAGLAAMWLLGGDEAEAPIAAQQDGPEAGEETTDEAVDVEDVDEIAEPLPTATYDVYLARDPFEPVRTPAASGDGGDENEAISTAPDADDDSGSANTPGESDNGAESGCQDQGTEQVCNGHVVSLMDVTTDESGNPVAVIQVDTTVYEARAGETFATFFLVRDIRTGEVVVSYGDETFTLAVGGSVTK